MITEAESQNVTLDFVLTTFRKRDTTMDKLLLFVIIIILAYVCVRLFNKNKEIKAMANRMAEEIRKECEEEIKNVQRRAAADLTNHVKECGEKDYTFCIVYFFI